MLDNIFRVESVNNSYVRRHGKLLRKMGDAGGVDILIHSLNIRRCFVNNCTKNRTLLVVLYEGKGEFYLNPNFIHSKILVSFISHMDHSLPVRVPIR